ncbi:MAG: N-acetyltransferase [Halobacteriovoraceae bacterium]|nr:N-acetyltransferase [Halobacteriovoraceae bacterium]
MSDKSSDKYLIISDDVKLGQDVKIWSFVNLYGCEIGNNSSIGAFVEIQKDVTIGENCKISSHTFICSGVHIEKNCFVGHGVIFINDKRPKSVNEDGSLQNENDWDQIDTHIGKNVSIGSGAIIMCGVRVGENAVIGAGAVVTRDVKKNETVAGVPARVLALGKKAA